MKLTIIKGLLMAGMLVGTMSAQSIHQRDQKQQDRIAQGVQSGALTPHETARLEHREAHVNREIRRDRFRNGGHLTHRERAHIRRQQNHISRAVYRDKNNARRF
jgi:hypothetical protein